MKTIITAILATLLIVSCAPKKVIYPDVVEYVDVHFIVTGQDTDVVKQVVYGIPDHLDTVIITGNMDKVLSLEKGTRPPFTLWITSLDDEKQFINKVEIKFKTWLCMSRSNTCPQSEYGFRNEIPLGTIH